MGMEALYAHRERAAAKLMECLSFRGITKTSLCHRAGISRPTLDRLLRCGIDNEHIYAKHMEKILTALQMTAEELLQFSAIPQEPAAVTTRQDLLTDDLSETARHQYQLLFAALDLCSACWEEST